MSQPIEIPESKLTDALIEDYMAFRRGPDDPLIWQEHFQDLCGLLIKHGLVSPPVYVIRDTDNDRLLHEIVSGEVFMTANLEKVQIDGAVFDHWKGQME